MTDVQFDLVPKFGDFNNSEPAKQGQVTVNTYLDEGEYNIRVNSLLREADGDSTVVYPYGKFAPTKKTFSVKENEPALMRKRGVKGPFTKDRKRDSRGGGGGGWYNHKGLVPKKDNYAHVFNSLNGMSIDLGADAKAKWEALHEEEKKAYIRAQFRLVGTIGTTYDYESKIGMAYFPTRLAGVFAMRNGSKQVSAGQYLMIDAPAPNPKADSPAWKRDAKLQNLTDIPQDKVVMEVVPFNPNELPSLEVLEHYLGRPGEMSVKLNHINEVLALDKGVEKVSDRLTVLNTVDRFLHCSHKVLKKMCGGVDREDILDTLEYQMFKDLIDAFFLVRAEQKSRMLGRALSDAEPGAQLDVYVTEGYGN